MSRVGVRPVPGDHVRHWLRHGFGVLPDNAIQALRWLRRGHLVTSPLLPLAVRQGLLRLAGVRLGPVTWGLERCWFESEHVTIGTGSGVNAGCWFEGHGRIVIGRDCLIGPEVMIITSVHEIGDDGGVAREPSYREVRIHDGCWLGARVTVLPGVTIGPRTIVAAGAVVTKDCGPDAVYAGVPARRLRLAGRCRARSGPC
jgi:maltose O-acetyltransferase